MSILFIKHLIYLLTNGMYNLHAIHRHYIYKYTHQITQQKIICWGKIQIKVYCKKIQKLSVMNFHSSEAWRKLRKGRMLNQPFSFVTRTDGITKMCKERINYFRQTHTDKLTVLQLTSELEDFHKSSEKIVFQGKNCKMEFYPPVVTSVNLFSVLFSQLYLEDNLRLLHSELFGK